MFGVLLECKTAAKLKENNEVSTINFFAWPFCSGELSS